LASTVNQEHQQDPCAQVGAAESNNQLLPISIMSSLDQETIYDLGAILQRVDKMQIITFIHRFPLDMNRRKEIHMIDLSNSSTHHPIAQRQFPGFVTEFIVRQRQLNNMKETSERSIHQLRYLGQQLFENVNRSGQFEMVPSNIEKTKFEELTEQSTTAIHQRPGAQIPQQLAQDPAPVMPQTMQKKPPPLLNPSRGAHHPPAQ